MIKNYFPSVLNVEGRPCWVVGNDQNALGKAERLVDAKARVTLIASRFSPETMKTLERRGITVLERGFTIEDITDQFLIVFSAKEDEALVEKAFHVCRERRILVCAIDRPRFCDLVNVSVFKKGHLKIMISTDGAAPGVSRKIRLGLDRSLKQIPIDRFLDRLAELRINLEKEIPDQGERIKRLLAAIEGFEFKAKVKLP